PDGRKLLGVGAPGTRLLELRQSELRTLSRDPAYTALIASLIEAWVEAVCGGIARDVSPTRCTELSSNQKTSLPAASFVRSHPAVGWVTHLQGKSLLLGDPALVVNG